jgi:hypothetical protein
MSDTEGFDVFQRLRFDYLDVVKFHSSPSAQTLEDNAAVLPLIGQHYIGRSDPADSVTPVNSVISWSAVPPPCSITRRSYPGEVGPDVVCLSPPRGTESSKTIFSASTKATRPRAQQAGKRGAAALIRSPQTAVKSDL